MATSLETLVTAQTARLALLKTCVNNFKKSKSNLSVQYVENKLKSLDENWTNYEDGHFNILISATKHDHTTNEYLNTGTFDVEESYYQDS